MVVGVDEPGDFVVVLVAKYFRRVRRPWLPTLAFVSPDPCGSRAGHGWRKAWND